MTCTKCGKKFSFFVNECKECGNTYCSSCTEKELLVCKKCDEIYCSKCMIKHKNECSADRSSEEENDGPFSKGEYLITEDLEGLESYEDVVKVLDEYDKKGYEFLWEFNNNERFIMRRKTK